MERSRSILISFLLFICLPLTSLAGVKGIYLTQLTTQNRDTIAYLVKNAKEVGIDTFVIDYANPNPHYTNNVAYVKQHGLRYVARVVIFPGGATPEQATSQAYINERLARMKEAIALGADEIQIDYIRFKPTQKPSPENGKRVAEIVGYFRDNIPDEIPLQIDVFGISSFKPSVYIGQNIALIAPNVDAINPMVYPSHYDPFLEHARQPYKTIYESLMALKKQIPPEEVTDTRIHAYIELFNYRYPMSVAQRKEYIHAEMKAVADAHIDGWYVWSAGNHYDILFDVLRNMPKVSEEHTTDNDSDSNDSNKS
jgi:hypothetical protein